MVQFLLSNTVLDSSHHGELVTNVYYEYLSCFCVEIEGSTLLVKPARR